MRDHDDSVAFGVESAKLFHNDMGGAAIKVAGGLVGENDGGVGNKSASDSDALLLAAGKLGGEVIFTFFEAEGGEDVGSAF